jgi:methylmalonyl-CoA mutase N-terminal domain/subunit
LWARIAKDRFGAADPRSMTLRFHVQTAGSTLTAQQPETNAVRTTVQALAAILGGTQSLHTNALDEALGLPSPQAARLALRTQQVLAYESGLSAPIDPLGGSWFVESLTDELDARATAELARLDELGGPLAALEAGYQVDAIADAAYADQRAFESGEAIVVGVNAFVEAGEVSARPQPQAIDPEAEAAQATRTRAVRESRDQVAAAAALAALSTAAVGTENLLPRIGACVEARVTLGEISDALRAAWGEHRP